MRKGYFRLTKQVDVTLTFFELIEVELFESKDAGTMFGLDVEINNEGITVSFDASYGAHGRIKAKRIVVSFEPKNLELVQNP